MQIIGLNGKKRSGKDTSCVLLGDIAPGVQRVSFADKVKLLAAYTLGYTGTDAELIARMDNAKADDNGRNFLKLLGTKARDVLSEDLWVDQILPAPVATPWSLLANAHNLKRRYPGVETLVITDVRFENEAHRVRALGGVIWEIVRPQEELDDDHISERPLPRDLVDRTIVNDADMHSLAVKLNDAYEDLRVS